jgi:predicted nicotinamide N-methyase
MLKASLLPSIENLEALLDTHAPFQAAPLCPEIRVFHGSSLVEVWQAAEVLAGETLPSPFWAFAWPAGCALARTVLDHPHLVRDRVVLDFGCGGGIASLACAHAGARRVVANDVDPWAVAVTQIAAERQGLHLETLLADLTAEARSAEGFDVVLAGDLFYDRSTAPRERAVLDSAQQSGAHILIADAGRTYFDATGLTLIGDYVVDTVRDLEGSRTRRTRVFEIPGA